MWCSCDISSVSFTSHNLGFHHDVINDVIFFPKISTYNIGLGLPQEQQLIINFLMAKGILSFEIHRRPSAAFKDDSVSCSRHVHLSGMHVFVTSVSREVVTVALVRCVLHNID